MPAANVQLSESLLDHVEQRRSQCRRARSSLAVLHIRLSSIADCRQKHGEAIAQALLDELGRRLRSRIRDSDEVLPDSRTGFAVLLPGAGQEESAHVRARLQAVLAGPCRVGALLLQPTVVVEASALSTFEPPAVAALPATGTAG
jgi:GGDEF domain-containing protein